MREQLQRRSDEACNPGDDGHLSSNEKRQSCGQRMPADADPDPGVLLASTKISIVTIEMRHAPFFGWIHDLSAVDPTNRVQPVRAAAVRPDGRSRRFCIWAPGRSSWAVTMFAQQKHEPAAAGSGPGAAVSVHADHLHVHAGALSGRARDLLVDWNNTLTVAAAMADPCAAPSSEGKTRTRVARKQLSDALHRDRRRQGWSQSERSAEMQAAWIEAGRLMFAAECAVFLRRATARSAAADGIARRLPSPDAPTSASLP